MLARVAETIYWLSRYLERAENTVRLVDVHSRTLLDLPGVDDHAGWIPLISIHSLDKEFAEKHGQANEQNVCDFLLADKDNPSSLSNAFVAIHNNLRSCRDIVPRSSYEAINGACRFVRSQVDNISGQPNQRNAFLSSVQTRLLAISGNLSSNMSHDIAYRFMQMGCNIERADMTSRVIDVQSSRLISIGSDAETMALQQQRWVYVLRTLSATQMYRQHIRRPINGHDTLQYLLHDRHLPRSYLSCIERLNSALSMFNRHEKPRAAIDTLQKLLRSAELDEMAQQPAQLHKLIDALQLSMQDVANVIADTYFLPLQES